MLREIDGVTNNERLGYFRDVTRRSSYGDQMLFPPLARQLAPFNNNNSSSAQGGNNGSRGGAPQGRHSFGGGGGGDNGRSVVVRYQETAAQRSQSVGPRVQQGRSALESTTSSLGKRKAEPELASRYASLHPPPQEQDRPALSSRGRDEGHRDRQDRDRASSDSNSRRNSFPANGAARGHSSNNAPAHSRFASPEPSRHQQGSSGHKNRPQAPVLSVPPMAAASAAWNERIESRKRRFNE